LRLQWMQSSDPHNRGHAPFQPKRVSHAESDRLV
jgi:hypothetical protein